MRACVRVCVCVFGQVHAFRLNYLFVCFFVCVCGGGGGLILSVCFIYFLSLSICSLISIICAFTESSLGNVTVATFV